MSIPIMFILDVELELLTSIHRRNDHKILIWKKDIHKILICRENIYVVLCSHLMSSKNEQHPTLVE